MRRRRDDPARHHRGDGAGDGGRGRAVQGRAVSRTFMVTIDGPKVLEFNCRFGDPEAEVLLPRLESRPARDHARDVERHARSRRCALERRGGGDRDAGVGRVSGPYETGKPIIEGLDDVDSDVMVFHAGTKRRRRSGRIVTAGGRCSAVTATGATLPRRGSGCTRNVARIRFEGMHYGRTLGRARSRLRGMS